MKFVSTSSALALAALVCAGTASAADYTAKPAASISAPAMPAKVAHIQSEVSRQCSEEANAKGLHGKERRAFRSHCMHPGSKSAHMKAPSSTGSTPVQKKS